LSGQTQTWQRRWLGRVIVAAFLLGPVCASAQSLTPGKPGPYVIDLRGAMSGLPTSTAFHPAIPESALVPSRGFGLDVGGHVYVGDLGPMRLGFGANLVRARGTTNTLASSASAGATRTTASSVAASALSAADPIHVAMSLTAIAPQVSFNFGTSDGWSYLSGGYGAAWIRTTAGGTSAPPDTGSMTLVKENGPSAAVNYGGGARWFMGQHVAVGFDLRFLEIRTSVNHPRTTRVLASAGISVR